MDLSAAGLRSRLAYANLTRRAGERLNSRGTAVELATAHHNRRRLLERSTTMTRVHAIRTGLVQVKRPQLEARRVRDRKSVVEGKSEESGGERRGRKKER